MIADGDAADALAPGDDRGRAAVRLKHGWVADLPSHLRRRLQEEALASIAAYVVSRQMDDGGFCGRADDSDPYYTVFGLEALLWLRRGDLLRPVVPYLDSLAARESLTFLDLVCLARCRERLGCSDSGRSIWRQTMAQLYAYRTADGGFHSERGHARLSIYDTFLAWMAAPEVIGDTLPVDAVRRQMHDDGSFPGRPGDELGAAPPTAAALVLLASLGAAPPSRSITFLSRCRSEGGGWKAAPVSPAADLLSTATVLHALRACGYEPEGTRHAEDYVISLWHDSGGFLGCERDTEPDVEYTFYGLLALACLAEQQG